MSKATEIVSDELYEYKQALLNKLIEGLDDGTLNIKEVNGQPYVSYDAVLDLVTTTKFKD